MLSAFPQLFNYSLLAITMLRVVFGVWFLIYGYTTLFKANSQDKTKILLIDKIISNISLIVGLLTIIGLFMQVAILIGLFILFLKWYLNIKSNHLTKEIFAFGFYIAIIGLSLLFLGPGAIAIDLPL